MLDGKTMIDFDGDSKAKVVADNLILHMSGDEGDSDCSGVSSNSDKQPSDERKRKLEEDMCQKKEANHETDFHIHVQDNKLENNRDEENDLIEDELGLSDSEDSMYALQQTGTKQKNKRKKPLGPLELLFKCEWKNCSYETEEDSKFHVHVSYHIPDLEIKTLGNGEEVYKCLWAECSYLTGGAPEIQRHVTFHSYHTKLKNIGAEVIKQWKVPKCILDNEMRNVLPDIIDPMICEWSGCSKEFNNVQVFFQHIKMHMNEKFEKKMKCKWDGCKSNVILTKAALTTHMRTHTQEKVIGCPICGHLFATNAKLIDHCERQLPTELAQYQCSQCYKHYPSMRLLKDHMRGHIDFLKCCYCDMTCSNRHTFTAHIRYKHLDSKPFKCNMCDYACKTQHDLKLHLTSHDPNPQFFCEVAGCEFACRSKHTIKRHMIVDHKVSNQPVYVCHLPECKKQFKRGCYLTKHLMTKHCLRWPSGHSKFMFSREEDQVYKLRTVRYESMKLYKDKKKSPALAPKSNFKVTPQAGEGSRVFEVSSVDSNAPSEVLISIEDESGNTINSCTATEMVWDEIPKNATVIASADPKDEQASPSTVVLRSLPSI